LPKKIKNETLTMTINGYQTLETMNTNKVWSELKKTTKTLGIESLKQISSLAIKLISEYN